MAKFLTIGYGDAADYDRTAPATRDAAHAHDARLRAAGAVTGIAGRPVQVRNHDAAGVATTDGPFMASPLPVAGFALIEAATLDDAIEAVSQTPCAIAQGVVEVWPFDEERPPTDGNDGRHVPPPAADPGRLARSEGFEPPTF